MELTNWERKCMGLNLVQEHWIRKNFSEYYWIYIDGNHLVKRVSSDEDHYYESDVFYSLSENYDFIMPKTNRGKPRKLTESVVKNLSNGVYLFWGNGDVVIGNGNSEIAYYQAYLTGEKISNLNDFQSWIKDWVKNTTLEEQIKIDQFKTSFKKHQNYQEGDYFRVPIGRDLYGYGRILLDIRKRQKQGFYYWNIVMGKPIIIELFHLVTKRDDVAIEELKLLKTFPSQYILDNVIYYGEYKIIGHEELSESIAYPIMYGKNISWGENKICFQCGLIYLEKPYVKEQLIVPNHCKSGDILCNFLNNGVGFLVLNDLITMKKCIDQHSNQPYWDKYCNRLDLRNPRYHKELVQVLEQFDLLELLDLYQDV